MSKETPTSLSNTQHKILTRNRKIGASIIIFISIITILLVYNFANVDYFECDEDNCIKIYGNVKEDAYIGRSDLLSGEFKIVEIDGFYVYNRFHNTYTVDIIGVQIWDILNRLDIYYDNTTRLIFESQDGYRSPSLPISIMKNFPDCVLLVTHEGGKLLKDKSSGGDGPIISAVSYNEVFENQEVLDFFDEELNQDFVYNSAYKAKWLTSIQVL